MLPLPRHLLKIDPEDVLREIEDDPLSQFLWTFRPNIAARVRKLIAVPSSLLLTSCEDTPSVTECCTQ